MFNIGDIVMVQSRKDQKLVKCKIIDLGPDENDKIWYLCEPVEFQSIPREFTEDCLTKI